jgi:hypothetical protein
MVKPCATYSHGLISKTLKPFVGFIHSVLKLMLAITLCFITLICKYYPHKPLEKY